MANSLANDFTFYDIDLGGLNCEVFRKVLLILRGISSSWKQAGESLWKRVKPTPCSTSIPHPFGLTRPPRMDTHPPSLLRRYHGPGPRGLPPPGWLPCPALVSDASGHGFGGADGSAGPAASGPPRTESYDLKKSRRSVERTPLGKGG